MNELPVADVEIPVTCFRPSPRDERRQSGVGARPCAGIRQTCEGNACGASLSDKTDRC